jgi:hypothetical protein
MWRRRERWPEASAALAVFIVLVLTAGEFATYAPATVMNKLPLFSSFRIPSRHTLLLPILGALCTAFLVRQMEGASRHTWLRRLVEALCVVAVLQLVLVNRQQLEDVFILPPADSSRVFERVTPRNEQIDVPRIGAPERVLFTNMLGSMLAGVSTFHCWEPLQLKKVARLGPAAIEGGSGVSVTGSAFSPNRIAASVVVASAPARVVLNQNFSEGWSSTIGIVERDPETGRPSVLLPANYTGEIAFRFFPRGLWLGLAVWLVTVAVSVLAWRRVTG